VKCLHRRSEMSDTHCKLHVHSLELGPNVQGYSNVLCGSLGICGRKTIELACGNTPVVSMKAFATVPMLF